MNVATANPKIPLEIINFFSKISNSLLKCKDVLYKVGQVADKFFLSVFTATKDTFCTCFSAFVQSVKDHPYIYIIIPVAIIVIAIIGVIIGTIIYIKNNDDIKSC